MPYQNDPSFRQADEQLTVMRSCPVGDPRRAAARSAAVLGYLPVADRIARRYAQRGERLDDLTQVARLGLIKAVDGFDPELGPFLGYAVPTIAGELKRYFRDACWNVRVPRRLQELRLAAAAAAERMAQRTGREPGTVELAAELGVATRELTAALATASAYTPVSLDAPGGGDGIELVERLGEPDERVEQVPDRVSLRPALRRLPERERRVLAMRFFEQRTQAEIGAAVGLSQMHVSRLIARTLVGLRDWIDGDASRVEVCRPRRRPARRPVEGRSATTGRPTAAPERSRAPRLAAAKSSARAA
ncbi:SigB/SigF/SigG family RNA polymerase sigma factor [Actinocatenispora sera]|uniref:SigB/SigF/SigG family RNA polymerase sigma factor n=1 Tax=Actinocatenispora sera TaxID=390989 RepID=UPI0033C457E1